MKPAKFKMTELGPIPSDWEVKRLGEVCVINPSSSRQIPDSFVYIDLESVVSGQLVVEKKISHTLAPSRAQRLFSRGDVLYQTVRPYQRNNLFVDFDASGYVASTGYAVLHPVNSVSDSGYIFQQIHFPSFVSQVLDNCTGTSYPAINPHKLGEIIIPLPPLPEQHRIAAALSDMDELIGALGKLVEKKRAIKTGAMQRLLTGQTRLPGFGGTWVEKRLGDVCLLNPSSGEGIPHSFIYIDLESVANGRLTEKKTVLRSQAPSRAQRRFMKGDILFQTVRPYQKNNLFVDFEPENYIASTGYTIMRGIEAYSDSLFIYHIIHMDNFVLEVLDRCTGTSYPAINPQSLAEITIHIPTDIAEQRAIAAVLSDMDEEIAALEAEKRKVEAIKQGMMQELLTGKTRLKGE